MAECKCKHKSELGFLGGLAALAGIVGTFTLGPIDLGRTVYNQVIGDTPVIKRQLIDYCIADIERKHPDYSIQKVGDVLASELEDGLEFTVNSTGKVTIDPQTASMENLWDASEDHAQSWYQRWVWPSL